MTKNTASGIGEVFGWNIFGWFHLLFPFPPSYNMWLLIQLVRLMANRYLVPREHLVNLYTHSNFEYKGKINNFAVT